MNVLDFKKDVGLWFAVLTVRRLTVGYAHCALLHMTSLLVFLSECDEHDACHQYPLRPHEGQPSVVDPKSLPVQR